MEEQVLTPNDILIQQYKQFGRQHVLTHKLASWDKMVEEKIIYHPTALQSAIFAMEDLDNGVEYSAIQQGINFMCRKPNALAITQLILFEYAKKGPDFLLKTNPSCSIVLELSVLVVVAVVLFVLLVISLLVS